MKRLVLGLGLVGSLTTFATTNNIQANAKLETKYMEFNNDNTQEYKNMWSVGVKGNIKYGDWVIQVGDTYQKWKLANWLKQLTNRDNFYANIPYIRFNRLLGDKVLGIGLIYISGSNYLVSNGAWGLNINFAGRLYNANNLKAIGEIFYQYTSIRNGKAKVKIDVSQFTPNILLIYDNIVVNPYITLQNINAHNVGGVVRFSGGVKFKAKVNSMFDLSGNVKYGRTVYFSDGENMDIMARYNRFKANIGVGIKPMQHLTITPKVYYEGYETFDKNTGDTKIQKGWGIGLNISYNF